MAQEDSNANFLDTPLCWAMLIMLQWVLQLDRFGELIALFRLFAVRFIRSEKAEVLRAERVDSPDVAHLCYVERFDCCNDLFGMSGNKAAGFRKRFVDFDAF